MHKLNGKEIAATLRTELKQRIAPMQQAPGLAAILVGDNPGSHTYVSIKEQACQEVGINFFRHEFEKSSTEELVTLIDQLNKDEKVHGILVQLPLPEHIDTDSVIQSIYPAKDADGFHQQSIDALKKGNTEVMSPVYAGVCKLLEETQEPLPGKSAVILANSQEFAKPLEYVLNQREINTISLIKTDNFSEITRQADIVIVAVGKAHLISAEDIKKDAILIDIGFNRVDGKVVGDIDAESVAEKAAYLSPVPGGVGPLTVAYLLHNTVTLSEKSAKN